MAEKPLTGFSVFRINDEVTVNRIGCKVIVKGRDNTFRESDTTEANLLFEIWKALKAKK